MATTIQSPPNDAEALWDKKQLAKYLNISVMTIDQWTMKKRGPKFVKIGPLVRFRPADVHSYLDSLQSEPYVRPKRDDLGQGDPARKDRRAHSSRAPRNGTTHKARATRRAK